MQTNETHIVRLLFKKKQQNNKSIQLKKHPKHIKYVIYLGRNWLLSCI